MFGGLEGVLEGVLEGGQSEVTYVCFLFEFLVYMKQWGRTNVYAFSVQYTTIVDSPHFRLSSVSSTRDLKNWRRVHQEKVQSQESVVSSPENSLIFSLEKMWGSGELEMTMKESKWRGFICCSVQARARELWNIMYNITKHSTFAKFLSVWISGCDILHNDRVTRWSCPRHRAKTT